MKQFNKSKLCALVTTAAVFMSNTAVLPSINTFAADGDAKTATITLTDNWSRMLTFTDIPQAEEKTTTVTLGQDYTKTLTYTADDEYQQLWDETTESGNWDFNAENSRDAIITAIEADGITLPEEPSFVINNITATYSWTLTSANGESLTNATVSFGSYGDDIDINSEDNQKTLTETSGTETVKVSELVTTGGTIENFGGLYIHAGATGNTGDTFTFEVTSVVLDVTYLDGENGGYKGLYDETIQLSNWHFAAHSPNEDAGDRSADIVAALKAETGDETAHWAIQITDMTVNYSWELTTTRVSDNYNIDFNPNPMGMTPAGSETWFEAGIQNGNYTLLEAKSGTGSVKASDVMAKSGVTVEDIHCMDINGGMWTDNPADTLTIKVTGITLNVTYTIEKPPVEAYVSYSDVQDAEYLSITCDVSTQAECGHENHIADDGTDYWAGQTYCPWPEVSMNKVDADGNWSDAYYNQWSTNNNVTTPSDDGGSINFMFPMSDIITALGTLSSGEQYVISGNSVNTIKYEFLAAKPDMILGTGSYEGGTIEEAMEFDPETNSEVATGIPNITPSFAIAEYENAVSFNGYDAIKIDYTAKSPEACYGVLVVLHGWEDNSTGWMEKFYAIEENGSIVIDLSSMQDKVFHNIYVGPVAPANSKIGDTFTPGFAVTSAKMVTSYDGSFTNEIAKPVPDEPTTEPETPTTSYTVKTTPTENGTVSVDKAAAA
ncbi:MAG: hypothetical protein IJZ61_09615, partial [Oscillospiraceae bacterium]|nr:hypothetical protein [Oscillospiraceae bacterium]